MLITLLVALQCLFAPMDLQQFVKSSSIKPENMIKLVLSGIIGLVCVWGTMRYPQVRETACSPRALMLFGIIFLTILGATHR